MPLPPFAIDEKPEISKAITRLNLAPTIVAPSLGDYYRLAPAPINGQGCLASRPITRGTRILEEVPLFSFLLSENNSDPGNIESLTQALGNLTLNDLNLFNALGPVGANDLERFTTNAFDMSVEVNSKQTQSGFFKHASQFNPSCFPNAFLTWNEHLGEDPQGRLTIHAIRDIVYGEEILINYRIEDSQNSSTDGRKLQDALDIVCNCPACNNGAPAPAQSKKNRRWIRDIIQTLTTDTEERLRTPSRISTQTQRYSQLRSLQKLLELLKIEGIVYPHQAIVYQWLAEWCFEELNHKVAVVDHHECREIGLKAARSKLDLDIVCNGCMSSEVHKALGMIRKLA